MTNSFKLTLTQSEANAPKPQRPDCLNLDVWLCYYDDLACWRATQAEHYTSGIEDSET